MESLASAFGLELSFPPVQESMPWYTLPIGISFYTFQTMSYTIDVYRGVMKPVKNILHVALYVCYFPQLIAGPIMRGPELMPQIGTKKTFDFDRFRSGLHLCLWGLFKKVCLADNLAAFVDPVYAAPSGYSGAALLLATYAFAVQIYCDFSGYSDIAIGLARILGFDLILNFNRPYLAASITEFWRRWHMSLSRWLRDYLYIPLGGNRGSKSRTYINLMITMLLGGLWHGANWTFVVWGGLHGLALAVHKLFQSRFKESLKPVIPLWKPFWILVTFHFVCLTWIFFRADDVGAAIRILGGILSFQGGIGLNPGIPCVIFAFLALVQIAQERGVVFLNVLEGPLKRWPYLAGSFFYTAVFLALILFARGEAEFIYFQF
jgi:D-alanyl-lipoteichoic acid acyltransferase DltB (MBOAT superfamily)